MTLLYKLQVLSLLTFLLFGGTSHTFPTDDRLFKRADGRLLWTNVEQKVQNHENGQPTLTNVELDSAHYLFGPPSLVDDDWKDILVKDLASIAPSPDGDWYKFKMRYWTDPTHKTWVQENNGKETERIDGIVVNNHRNRGHVSLYLGPTVLIVYDYKRDKLPHFTSAYIWFMWVTFCRSHDRDPSVLDTMYQFAVTNTRTMDALNKIVPADSSDALVTAAGSGDTFYTLLGLPNMATMMNLLVDADGIWKAPTSVDIIRETVCDLYHVRMPLAGLPG
ncbi:hypothetical protein BDV95DRAFT_591852 [Massariosphaeria phaeospora]|uniref:Uncharacterized protein n=1 Tax=Massariosphaeria phaeospora TaxID=100035 RepID=A0A7C8MJV7_9PLEO|nr:hypothetical protein BDV95DRAFT_591852 [Massariosphaeria phaeospora]